MLYTKTEPQSFLGSGEEDFKCFFHHIWAWWPACSMVWNRLNKLSMPFDSRSHVKSGDNWSSGFRVDV